MQRTAERMALLGDLSRFAKDPGAIRQWLVLSPPPGFFGGSIQLDEEQLPDEARLRPRAQERVRPNHEDRVWTPLQLEDYRLDFQKTLKGTHPPMVAYAVSYILSDRDQSGLILKIGSDYDAKLYLNQREIHRSVHPATVEPDRDTVTGIELKAGLNVLVFKVVRADRDADSPWGGSVRFTHADGSPVSGLTVTLDPDAKQ